jgi:hypothetical protein
MRKVLEDAVSHPTIVSMSQHKLGPVFTVLAFDGLIYQDEPVIISYCDTVSIWDYNDFKGFVSDIDGCVVSHTGFHPHTLSPTLFAYSKTDTGNRILGIKEKACYTNNRFDEHASSGVYYFGKGSYVSEYFKQALEKNVSYNGEYYVTLVYNLLIKDKLKVFSYLTDYVLSFGTPLDVEMFNAWQHIIKGGQVRNMADAIKSYKYWMKYAKNFP